MFIHHEQKRLEELINLSPQEKRFDRLLNSLNLFSKEMYENQSGEFVCGYWGFKSLNK